MAVGVFVSTADTRPAPTPLDEASTTNPEVERLVACEAQAIVLKPVKGVRFRDGEFDRLVSEMFPLGSSEVDQGVMLISTGGDAGGVLNFLPLIATEANSRLGGVDATCADGTVLDLVAAS